MLALQKSDDKDDKAKDNKGRETAERIEKQLKELVDKLGKDVSPVGQEVRKALERSVDEIHRALQKDGMTPDELRQALEKSREELRKSFDRDGPVQKEMREASRTRSQGDARVDGARPPGGRTAPRGDAQADAGGSRTAAQEGRGGPRAQKKASEARRKMAEETQQRARRTRPIGNASRAGARVLRPSRGRIPAIGRTVGSWTPAASRSATCNSSWRKRPDASMCSSVATRDGASPRLGPPSPASRAPAEPGRARDPARPADPAPNRARPATPRDNLQPGRDRDDKIAGSANSRRR